ncbi:Uncharacterised protein [Serratia quinivorans]|uniref:hypothetical protein n=1 Tax=Serratia quinivorans TaxID=137545 RepID=UPI000D903F48|nr:hypothetical protein [Serratia quinivorans]SPZ61690.1 Uncharacterised protein [Serratia quinivorans]VEI63824.1 Uncharacterised protein [Serratia quinivorans]
MDKQIETGMGKNEVSHEQWLREKVDAAFERLSSGEAVYIGHSLAEKRMAIFKKKVRDKY